MATVPVRLSTRSAEPVGGTGLVTDAERRAAEHRHRRTVERDLLSGDTRWRSTPYEAHVQFSTYCNLACVMCWGDRPPPSRRLEPAVLALLLAGAVVARRLRSSSIGFGNPRRRRGSCFP